MRLITGATSNSNIMRLFQETSWQPLRKRSENTILIMFYKIVNNLGPTYLLDLLPRENKKCIVYNLRNDNDYIIPFTRLEVFKRSFVPTAIRLWNRLNFPKHEAKSLSQFKSSLSKETSEPNILYFYGERWASVHHARLRMGCSMLNYDLVYNTHVSSDPKRPCGASLENAKHFFMEFLRYTDIRIILFESINRIVPCSLEFILFGSKSLKNDFVIFDAVHTFIKKSGRFC